MAMAASTSVCNVAHARKAADNAVINTGANSASAPSLLNVVSYDLHGFNQGLPALDELLGESFFDIVLIQEH